MGQTGSGQPTTRSARSTTVSTNRPPPPSASTSTSAPTPVASAARPCGDTPTAPAHYQHVVWIWMENHTWGDVFGNASAPYLNALAGKCGTDSDYASVGSP